MDKLSTTSYPQDPLTALDPNDCNIIEVDDDNIVEDLPPTGYEIGQSRLIRKQNAVKRASVNYNYKSYKRTLDGKQAEGVKTCKQAAYQALRLSGLDPKVAVHAAGYKSTRTAAILDKKLAGLPEAVRLDSLRKLKLASQATERLVKGLPVGRVKVVKDSTVLGAAEAIYRERARRESYQGPEHLTINLIDLRPFSGGLVEEAPPGEIVDAGTDGEGEGEGREGGDGGVVVE